MPPPMTPSELLACIDEWEASARERAEAEAVEAQARAAFDEACAQWRSKHVFSFQRLGEMPPQIPLIHGNLLFRRTTAWIAGAPGTYKSFLSLDWAMCVATGHSWLGRRVERGRVLYIAGEGAAGMYKRGLAWLDSKGMSVEALKDTIDFMGPTNLLDPATRAYLTHLAADGYWALIVVDTQARATPGVNENAKEELDPFISFLTSLAAEHGATTLTVHHATKSGSDPLRGSGAIHGAADSVFVLTREEDTQLEVELKVWKQKETESGAVIPLELVEHMQSLVVSHGIALEDRRLAGLDKLDGEEMKKLFGHILDELCAVGPGVYTKTRLASQALQTANRLRIRLDQSGAFRLLYDLEDRGALSFDGGKAQATENGRSILGWSRAHGYAPSGGERA